MNEYKPTPDQIEALMRYDAERLEIVEKIKFKYAEAKRLKELAQEEKDKKPLRQLTKKEKHSIINK